MFLDLFQCEYFVVITFLAISLLTSKTLETYVTRLGYLENPGFL